MSSKNGHTQHPPYISRVRLKGYKSIIDTEVDLHPGLNIIIGPNGSGKTNFLEFLTNSIISKNPEAGSNVHIDFFVKNKTYTWIFKDAKKTDYDNTSGEVIRHFKEWIYEKSQNKPTAEIVKISNVFSIKKGLHFNKFLRHIFPITLISYTLPKKIKGLDTNLSIEFNASSNNRDLFGANISYDGPFKFISNFLLSNFFIKRFSTKTLLSKDEIIKKIVIDDEVKSNLKKFSPIKDIELQGGISIKGSSFFYQMDYIGFNFLVNDNWLTWQMLSDGTKRLFYIISEITLTKGICFIEEPEIGVHPDQYRQILSFLKEQSEDKQIIITTHAPRSLDILKDNELNKIILTRFDKELGTKMRHLTKEEIKHAIQYRENDGSTSELWTYTGFFDEEEVI